jgi:hypothetical protein
MIFYSSFSLNICSSKSSHGLQEAEEIGNKTLYYTIRQYGGLVLGIAGCLGTYLLYEQNDRMMVWKLLACALTAIAGLGMHEFRPYKRVTA